MQRLPIMPQDQTFWYLNTPTLSPLTNDISTDVLIIGGGMAGLTTAQAFAEKGCAVVLIEKNYCGAGASGKSSGFITPDSELSLFELIRIFGPEIGKKLWKLIGSGVEAIQNNIQQYNINCDYQAQDTLILANTARAFSSDIQKEYDNRQQAGYTSTLYTRDELSSVIGSDAYHGGISYGGTFGIQGYNYCLSMKKVLQELGVLVYEETPALHIQEKKVTTPRAIINANHIIVCTDRFELTASLLWDKIYHVQTFLMLSCPLSEENIKKIFPHKRYMVWDTDMIYQYYRLTGDNRLMLGGSNLLYTYAKNEKHGNNHVAKKLLNYFNTKFPNVAVEFEYMWPGLIGISKDVFPVAGFDQRMPSVYYIAGACGLPFAAALGMHCADRIINNNKEFDDYFSPYRSTTLGPVTQSILGTRLTFALSNFLSVGSL
ncbi:MAG TPA: FAD-binding oxidoreductase [Candidatus Babeliales bacterium]|nr:FAD-binding oxidoreductase [Candidatus Babeliales bacterium]